MSMACGMHGRDGKFIQNIGLESLKVSMCLEDLDTDETLILK
jgi:hypothetical protein